jgi:hypothetical protein
MGKDNDYSYQRADEERREARRFDTQREALKLKANHAIEAPPSAAAQKQRDGVAAEIAEWARRARPNYYCKDADGVGYSHPQSRLIFERGKLEATASLGQLAAVAQRLAWARAMLAPDEGAPCWDAPACAADLDVDAVDAVGALVAARACPAATRRWWGPAALAQLFGLRDAAQQRWAGCPAFVALEDIVTYQPNWIKQTEQDEQADQLRPSDEPEAERPAADLSEKVATPAHPALDPAAAHSAYTAVGGGGALAQVGICKRGTVLRAAGAGAGRLGRLPAGWVEVTRASAVESANAGESAAVAVAQHGVGGRLVLAGVPDGALVVAWAGDGFIAGARRRRGDLLVCAGCRLSAAGVLQWSVFGDATAAVSGGPAPLPSGAKGTTLVSKWLDAVDESTRVLQLVPVTAGAQAAAGAAMQAQHGRAARGRDAARASGAMAEARRTARFYRALRDVTILRAAPEDPADPFGLFGAGGSGGSAIASEFHRASAAAAVGKLPRGAVIEALAEAVAVDDDGEGEGVPHVRFRRQGKPPKWTADGGWLAKLSIDGEAVLQPLADDGALVYRVVKNCELIEVDLADPSRPRNPAGNPRQPATDRGKRLRDAAGRHPSYTIASTGLLLAEGVHGYMHFGDAAAGDTPGDISTGLAASSRQVVIRHVMDAEPQAKGKIHRVDPKFAS